ncbi:MAG: SDR family oxidoreductase [Solirubrobacteraceae bacterium]|nr:SDR family oxidoreductase [Patulibacter sp.]
MPRSLSEVRFIETELACLGSGRGRTAGAALQDQRRRHTPAPDGVDYAATKAAINNLSKGLAQQLAPRGIRVNIVAPGPTWTALQVSAGENPDELPEFGASENNYGRPGQPAELAPAYVFLASPESSYVAGATINVNGAMVSP